MIKKALFLLFVWCSTAWAQLPVINTVAGSSGAFPSGVTAASAPLGSPNGVAVDSSGNVYISDGAYTQLFRVSGGIVTHFAGDGVLNNTGDGGPATAAAILPSAVALDSSGNLYIASGNRLRKINPAGIISNFAGFGNPGFSGDGGPATLAQFESIRAVAVDGSGNVFVIDNNRVRRIDTGGTINTVAGNGSTAFSGDSGPAVNAGISPMGVAVDSAFNLYITDANHRIRKVAGGIITTVAGTGSAGFSGDSGPAISATLNQPGAIAVDSAGNLYFVDTIGRRVRKITVGGTITTVAGSSGVGFGGDGGPATSAFLNGVSSVTVDAAGNIYIADTINRRIRRVDTGGTITTIAGNGQYLGLGEGGPATSSYLESMNGVAIDPRGNLYIALKFSSQTAGQRICKVDTSGILTTVVGTGTQGFSGDGVPALNAQLNAPGEMAFDTAGNLFFADVFNNRIRKVDTNGIITTVAGNGSDNPFSQSGSTPLTTPVPMPSGVAVDLAGNLYIGEPPRFNGAATRIRRLTPTGVWEIVAGGNTPGFSGDNGPANLAQLTSVGPMRTDVAGNLYFIDGFRIRKINTAGVISTVAGNPQSSLLNDGMPATNAGIVPNNIAVDSTNKLYLSMGNRVYVVSAGIINRFVGAGFGFSGDGSAAINAFLMGAWGLTVDAADNLYLVDLGNHRVRKVGTSTVPLPVLSGLTPNATLAGTVGFTLNVAGSNFVSGALVRWNGAERPTQFVSSTQLQASIPSTDLATAGPVPITAVNPAPGGGPSNALNFAVNPLPPGPYAITQAATALSTTGATLNGSLNPNGLATTAWFEWSTTPTFASFQSTAAQPFAAGSAVQSFNAVLSGLNINNTYFFRAVASNSAATNRASALSFTTPVSSPIITTVAGSSLTSLESWPALSAPLGELFQLAASPSGDVFFEDSEHSKIGRISPAGVITVLGDFRFTGFEGDGGPSTNARFFQPYGMAADAAGNLFIVDTGNYRVRKIGSDGIITTVVGTGESGLAGDGGPPLSAQLSAPISVALDGSGNLYIGDRYRVRKVSGGTITTVAGNGTQGISGDGGQATSASLQDVQGMAVDSAGNIYLPSNNTVRKVTVATGVITTIAGTGVAGYSGDGGPAVNAKMGHVNSVAVDPSGNLWIGDRDNNNVRKVSPSGTISTATTTEFSPRSLAADGAGNVYFTDFRRIRKIAPGGSISTFAGTGSLTFAGDGGPATSALLGATDVAVDPAGNLFIADPGNSRIRKVTIDGTISTLATDVSFQASNLLLDSTGNLYVSTDRQVLKVTPAGQVTVVAGSLTSTTTGSAVEGLPATSVALTPKGLLLDPSGNLYIAGGSWVYKVTTDNVIHRFAGSGCVESAAPQFVCNIAEGGSAQAASFGNAESLARDSAGNIYVADRGYHRVRKITPGGIISTIAGPPSTFSLHSFDSGYGGDGVLATTTPLDSPRGIVLDAAGNLYISDSGNRLIRRVDPTGVIWRVAGNTSSSESLGDGGPALAAQLSAPAGLALDGFGNLFIADGRVRKVAAFAGSGLLSATTGVGQPGTTVHVPVTLRLLPGTSVDSLTFSILVSPNAATPPPGSALSFQQASGLPAPVLSDAGPTFVTVNWTGLSPALSGIVTLGDLLVPVPGSATSGQSYSVTITGVSAALAAAPVSIQPDVNTSVVVGGLYKVGDVFPRTADVSGTFGDSILNILDLVQVLFAVNNVPGFRPAACSDRFDAMDLFPVDAGPTRGGDGLLDIRDLVRELFRVNNIDTERPQRAPRGLVCSGVRERPRTSADAEGVVGLGEPDATGVPVYLEARSDLPRVALTFALGDQSSQLRFIPAVAPTLANDSQPGFLALAWLDGITVRAGERLLLGHVTGSASLTIYGLSASGLDDNREVRLNAPASRR